MSSTNNILNTLGRTVYQLGFQISPIILVDGVASSLGGMLPIVAITEAANFVQGLLNGGTDLALDDFLCHFQPMAGTTLIQNEIGHYPFANQAVAANAIIAQPNHISFMMTATAKQAGGMTAKFISFLALKAVLDKHTAAGGTYTLLTPTAIYQNCLLLRLSDISTGQTKQAQSTFQWEFERPLLSLAEAAVAQNSLISSLDSGTKTDGSLSSLASGVGENVLGSLKSVLGTLSAGVTSVTSSLGLSS